MKKKKRSTFQEFMDFLDEIIHWILVSGMFAMLICVLAQVISRYVFKSTLKWTEEIARWLLVWLAFLGASHVAKTSSFTMVDFFVNKMPEKVRGIVNVVDKCLMLIFIGYFSVLSFNVYTNVASHEVGPATQLPMMIVRSSLIIGPLITFLQMIAAGGIHLLPPEEESESI